MRLLLIALACLISVSVFGQQTYVPDDIFEQHLIDLGYDDENQINVSDEVAINEGFYTTQQLIKKNIDKNREYV